MDVFNKLRSNALSWILLLVALPVCGTVTAFAQQEIEDSADSLSSSDVERRLGASRAVRAWCDSSAVTSAKTEIVAKKIRSRLFKETCETAESNSCQTLLNLIWALRNCGDKEGKAVSDLFRLLEQSPNGPITADLEETLARSLIGAANSSQADRRARLSHLLDLVDDDPTRWGLAIRIVTVAFEKSLKDSTLGSRPRIAKDLLEISADAQLFERVGGLPGRSQFKLLNSLATTFVQMLDAPTSREKATELLEPSAGSFAQPSSVADFGLPRAALIPELTAWLAARNTELLTGHGGPIEKSDKRSLFLASLLNPATESLSQLGLAGFLDALSELLVHCMLREQAGDSACLSSARRLLESESVAKKMLKSDYEAADLVARSVARVLILEKTEPIKTLLNAFKDSPSQYAHQAVLRTGAAMVGSLSWKTGLGVIQLVSESDFKVKLDPASTRNRLALAEALAAITAVLKADWAAVSQTPLSKPSLHDWGEAKRQALRTLAKSCDIVPNELANAAQFGGRCVEGLRRAVNAERLEKKDFAELACSVVKDVEEQKASFSRQEAWLMAGRLVQLLDEEPFPDVCASGQTAGTTDNLDLRILGHIFETLNKDKNAPKPQGLKQWKSWWDRQEIRPPF